MYNTWMNDPTFLAISAHLFSAALIVSWAMLFWRRIKDVWVVFAIGLLVAGVKEFYYDLKFELPVQTFGDSALDFAFYLIGGLVGVGVSYWVEKLYPSR